ncbi:unnamed protein product [Amoebophrya sp. A25]|nr:unnamed protein product [Amoebophrya sp. A25]|eukprot:GSA25T00007189001.1
MAVYVPGVQDNFVSAGILRDGCWECGLVNLILSALRRHPKAVFLDAGANLGIYSITVAKMGRHVFAFEPFFTTRIRLCKSIQRNHLGNELHLFRKGLSTKSGSRWKFRGTDSRNPGGVSINELSNERIDRNYKPEEEGTSWAESVRLDDYLSVFSSRWAKGHPLVMKMDIEGHECQAVAGMTEFLKHFSVAFVLMEWIQMYGNAEKLRLHHLDRFCPTLSALVQTFTDRGLVPSTVQGHRLNHNTPNRWDGVGDVVWEPGTLMPHTDLQLSRQTPADVSRLPPTYLQGSSRPANNLGAPVSYAAPPATMGDNRFPLPSYRRSQTSFFGSGHGSGLDRSAGLNRITSPGSVPLSRGLGGPAEAPMRSRSGRLPRHVQGAGFHSQGRRRSLQANVDPQLRRLDGTEDDRTDVVKKALLSGQLLVWSLPGDGLDN